MKSNRRSVLSMRFANIDLESAPGNYNVNDSRSCTLGDLPTIKFQAVSGLEISLPVIVDCLLTTYIDKMCPRGLFAAYERKEILSDHENSMMRTALCTIYTVLTRCRGPLIWLEDDLKDKANPHPLVNRLKEALSVTSMNIDFVTDPKKIDGKFLDRIFSLIDLDEVNDAYEESTFQILRKFKTSFFACSARLTDLMRKASPEESVRNIPAELQSTDEYLLLKEDERLLLSQLEVSVHIGAKECRHYLGTFSDTLLLKAGGGDGSWATEWGQDHKYV